MATNTEFAIRTGGDLYYDVNNTDSTSFTSYDKTNSETIRTELEALTWSDVGKIAGFSVNHTLENENETNAMNCGVGTFLKTADKTANINATMLEVNKMDVISSILGSTRESVAGTPVAGATQTATSGSWTYNTAFRIIKKDGDGTAVTVNSVTGGTDGLLVSGTDYFVGLDSEGYTTITIIDSATLTTETQDMVVDFDYTPNASENNTYVFENEDIPFGNYKFISCAYLSDTDTSTPWRRDYIYMVKFSLGGEIAERYLNIGENLEGAEVVLNGDLGGLYIKHIVKGATKASV